MKDKVVEVMSKKLHTVAWGTSLIDAAAMMEEKRIRHLPVVDEDGSILGMLSKKDINTINAKNLAVERVMTSPVLSIKESMPLTRAIYKMMESKVSCLVVKNEENANVGIVTTDDLLWTLAHLLENKNAKEDGFTNKVVNTVSEFIEFVSSGRLQYL